MNLAFYACVGVMTMIPCAQAQSEHRVEAVIEARDASLRTSITNQDIYLLRIKPKIGPEFEALGVDNYPSSGEPLPLAFVTQATPISIRLRRTPYCDGSSATSEAGAAVPVHCFAIAHGSWRAP
jgi:hypothetical protein